MRGFLEGFLLGVLLTALVAFRQRKKIHQSLSILARAAYRLAQGKGVTRVPVRDGGPMGDLTHAFNEMVDQFQSKIQEIESHRNQIEGILQGMAEGVLVIDSEGKLLLINESARNILEMGREAAPGRLFAEVSRFPALLQLVQEIMNTGESQSRGFQVYAPSERYLQVHATLCATPVSGPCALLVLHDVTDFKRLEQIRRDFVANVSHELKTPLTTMRAAAETLLDGALQEKDRGRPFVNSVLEETARLQRLVEDLLVLAQIESQPTAAKKEPIDLARFLQEEISRYQSLAQAHQVSLKYEATPSAPRLMANRDQLSQALGNLLDNAIKYNRPGGSVSVRTSAEEGACRIEVEDSGIGIPPQDLPRIFERFYRVDKARSRETGGTGLGLSIVKHMAESHGGTVEVQSQVDGGSRFTLILPLA